MKLVDRLMSFIIWLLIIVIATALIIAVTSLILGTAFAGVAILITGFKFLMSAVTL